eukprot:CAMPEP_0201685440 /NCGR_PEP_ID=MMETSP0578-20130828/190_1 /ASSEMBLY_ACC=CAM_ASM_000663 /TAXON_ID=267565 /ORGANISM="Skeletonema grethea, Strain CCMP 1804" /LENGTH=76 /DNA_ID=CAMNT_0048169325 /DNA_START=27 /DNA_END=257 /DNA_ORIENTATION=+
MANHYWYRNPYYHSYHGAQGMAQAQGYAQAADSAQPHYPAQTQGDRGHGSSPRLLPYLSPKSLKEEDNESDSKTRT